MSKTRSSTEKTIQPKEGCYKQLWITWQRRWPKAMGWSTSSLERRGVLGQGEGRLGGAGRKGMPGASEQKREARQCCCRRWSSKRYLTPREGLGWRQGWEECRVKCLKASYLFCGRTGTPHLSGLPPDKPALFHFLELPQDLPTCFLSAWKALFPSHSKPFTLHILSSG